jgi:NADPH:quinone reductase-like Zn-dependent oxidoreductase
MIAKKPESLSFEEAASAPVVAVTAWQMLFDYAKAQSGQSVLVHGAGGNVGPYAVQLARQACLRVFATASSDDVAFVESLGTEKAVDYGFPEGSFRVNPIETAADRPFDRIPALGYKPL